MNQNNLIEDFKRLYNLSLYSNSEKDLITFLTTKLSEAKEAGAREERERILKMREQIADELYGWDCYPRSDKQADAILKMITHEPAQSERSDDPTPTNVHT